MIQTTRYEDFGLIVHRGKGNVSAAEIIRTVEESHVPQALPLEIWDFSKAEINPLRSDEMGPFLGKIFEIGPPQEGEKTAFIVTTEKEEEMVLLFKQMAEFHDFPVELRVFSDLRPATFWLFGSKWWTVMKEVIRPVVRPDSHS